MTLYHAPQELLAWSSNLSGDFAALTRTVRRWKTRPPMSSIRAEPLGLSPPTNSTIDRLSSGLCRGGLVLSVVSLLLPALYVRPTPGVGWGGTFRSTAEFKPNRTG